MIARMMQKYIKDKGLKQTVIAKKAGLSDVEMSQYMTEKVRLPADVFIKICDALEVSPEKFREQRKVAQDEGRSESNV